MSLPSDMSSITTPTQLIHTYGTCMLQKVANMKLDQCQGSKVHACTIKHIGAQGLYNSHYWLKFGNYWSPTIPLQALSHYWSIWKWLHMTRETCPTSSRFVIRNGSKPNDNRTTFKYAKSRSQIHNSGITKVTNMKLDQRSQWFKGPSTYKIWIWTQSLYYWLKNLTSQVATHSPPSSLFPLLFALLKMTTNDKGFSPTSLKIES